MNQDEYMEFLVQEEQARWAQAQEEAEYQRYIDEMRYHRATAREGIIKDILTERESQDNRWGVSYHDNAIWNTILLEEVGEASKKILHRHFDRTEQDIYKELVSIAAVVIAWAEQLKEEEGT